MLFAIILLLVVIPVGTADDVVHWREGSIIIPTDPTIRFRLDIYSPTAAGSYPVMVFLTGLSGTIPATDYTTFLKNIARQKVIVIGIAKIENIAPEKMAVHLVNFLQWLIKPNDGATRLFAEHKAVTGVKPDVERLGFLSHSSAGHPLAQYLNGTCGPLKLAVMMNPVDGLDPFGIFDDFVTHPPNPLPYRIPTLIISADLDNVPSHRGFPPCASSNVSNDRFYRALYGPTFLVNFTDYGHGDNLDEPTYEGVKLLCGGCQGDACQFPQYKLEEATLITSFVYGIYNRDLELLKVVQNPQSYFKSHVANKYDLHNYDYSTGGPGGFCTHD